MNEKNLNFSSFDFMSLLFSYMKLNKVNKFDVIQLSYSLTNFFYANEYSFLFEDFKLRQTISNDQIIDLDSMIMDAILFGYINEKKEILLDVTYIKDNILPKYNEFYSETMEKLTKSVISKLDNYESDDKRLFIADLFYNPKFNFKRK